MEKQEKKKRSLGTEITLLTVLVSVCAILFLGTALIFIFFFFFSQKAQEDMEYILENTSQQFQDKMQFIGDGAVAVRHNMVLRDFFQKNHYDEKEIEMQLSYSIDLFSERNMAGQGEPFVVGVYLFNNKDEYVKEYYYPMTVAAEEEKDGEYGQLYCRFKESGRQYASLVQDGELELYFQVYDDDMKRMGACLVIIDQKALAAVFREIETYSNGSWIAVDGSSVLSAGGDERVWEEMKDMDAGMTGKAEMGGIHMLFSTEKCRFGIKAAAAVGFGNIYTILKPTLLVFLGVFVMALLLVAVAAFGMGYRLTRPFNEMTEEIRSFGQKDFDGRMGDFPIQEFHDISVVFNEMADRIKYLVTQVYEKQLLATQSQVKFLQAQINPHFQFNILVMLSLKAKIAGNEELYQCLTAFSKLIQGKIFRGKEIKIPLSDEIELVNFYLFLQNSRFQDKISYEIRYGSEEVKEDLIPRLLIEPLVENAVSHGLEPKEGDGYIRIDIYEQEDRLNIVVEDNGVGFEGTDTEVRGAERKPEESGHTHTGLVNTERLLRILYGGDYGLKITGKKGEGTRVEIELPVERPARKQEA